MVLSSPFSMWSLGGLEQPLLACMLMWAASLMLSWLDAARPSTGAAMGIGVFLGLACISRADAALFTAAFYTAAVVADKTADGTSMRSLLSRARILPVPILFFVGQLIFRKMYYHEWLPNTAYVKVAFTGHRLYTGIRYVCYAIRTDIVFVLLVAIGSYALWRAGRKKTVAFLLTVGCFWTIYLAVIGGDIFPAYRHFEPVIALFGYLVAGCAFLAVDAAGAWRRGAAAALLMLTALVSTSDALSDQEHWELEGKSLGLFLHQAFGAQQALLSSDAAGVVPFYAELPVLDPLGLNDYHIAHEASRVRGHGWVGHELGDGKYILDKKPDLLLFSSFEDDRPGFPADEQIVSDPRFAQYYQEVRFDTPEPHAIRAMLYIRRIDGRLGIEEGGTKIIVPGYLAKADAANSVHLVDGKAALVIPASGQAFFTGIPVAAGAWDVTIDPASAQGVNLSPDPPTATVQACTQCPAGVEFILQKKQDGEMGLVLSNTTAVPLTVKTITLTRK
jgi:hypothetical protein